MKKLARPKYKGAGLDEFCTKTLPELQKQHATAYEKFAICMLDAKTTDDLIGCTVELPRFIEQAKEAGKPPASDWQGRMKLIWNRCDEYQAELYAAKVEFAENARDGRCENGGDCPGIAKLEELTGPAGYERFGVIMSDAKALLREMEAAGVSEALRREWVLGVDEYCNESGRYPKRPVLQPPSLK